MFQLLPESKYPTEIGCFLTEHALIFYIGILTGSRKKSSLQEKNIRERVKFFLFRQNFETIILFDYSSSDTVSNQQIKLRFVLGDFVFLENRLY